MILALLATLLLAMLTLSAYADRVYAESGKFLARESQDNVDSWMERIEPRFGLSRDSIALSATILRLTSVAALSLLLGRYGASAPGPLALFPVLVELILVLVLFDTLVPQLLFARTTGAWVSRVRWLYQAVFYCVLPITLLLGLLLSIASLAEPDPQGEEDSPEEGVDALLEAGEEEGILEESDRELVRSVVEFGDLVVREIMTPRPELFAVEEKTTLAEFLDQLQKSNFSRVPVYSGTLDNVTGIAFAHDLLQVRDEDAGYRTVRDIQRPAVFVPEPKRVNVLLREMQSAKQHMRIVIDEYGAVAGLVTIEDLIEAIVGNIEDEHETPQAADAVERVDETTWIVPGSLDVADLRDLLNQRNGEDTLAANDDDDRERTSLRLPANLESSTVGGLVSELAGHIPMPGEVVEEGNLRLEVLRSTPRLVTRVLIRLLDDPVD